MLYIGRYFLNIFRNIIKNYQHLPTDKRYNICSEWSAKAGALYSYGPFCHENLWNSLDFSSVRGLFNRLFHGRQAFAGEFLLSGCDVDLIRNYSYLLLFFFEGIERIEI